ncbi:hypothetical protein EVAR_66654_1 [Eumeta japonica]|uniref:Uncharacterized protein n=1 Tax=Eumeta variegata TaxID=151549 RepID=A0A4C1ZLH8_EUMVA|nr:hypothetical protein EVAR_66654_1 [Eumeta japonica]
MGVGVLRLAKLDGRHPLLGTGVLQQWALDHRVWTYAKEPLSFASILLPREQLSGCHSTCSESFHSEVCYRAGIRYPPHDLHS